MLQGNVASATNARTFRQSMTLPEVVLRRALRSRPNGFNFRRQHPAGPYVADFYCHEARLIVEVDGEAHSCGDRPARDAVRDAWFDVRGFDVLRLPAATILNDLDASVRHIVETAKRRSGEE